MDVIVEGMVTDSSERVPMNMFGPIKVSPFVRVILVRDEQEANALMPNNNTN